MAWLGNVSISMEVPRALGYVSKNLAIFSKVAWNVEAERFRRFAE